jgi:hypothetical protein
MLLESIASLKLRRNKANRFMDIPMTRKSRNVGHNGVCMCWQVSIGFTNEIRSERSEDQFVRSSLPRAVLKRDLDGLIQEVSKREHHAMNLKNEPLEDIMMINSARTKKTS